METRIALEACVVLGSTLCGKEAADVTRRRVKTLDALFEGVRVLRVHMTSLFEPVQQALQRSENPLLIEVADGMRDGRGAGEAWRAVKPGAIRRGGAADALQRQDLVTLDTLFSSLGQSGREEQDALLDCALENLARLRESARQRSSEADRLYVSLGLLIGLMLALIVM